MRLRLLIPLLILAMAASLVALAVMGLIRDWEGKRAADRFLAAEQGRGDLVELAGDWALERGSAYVLLARAEPVAEVRLLHLREVRRQADARLTLLLELLTAPDRAPRGGAELAANLLQARRVLADLRDEMDQALVLPRTDRPAALADRWFGTLTALIDQARVAHQTLADRSPVIDPLIAAHAALRQSAWIAAEQSGRTRALLSATLLRGNGPAMAETLAEAETRFSLAWENVRQLSAQGDAGMEQVRVAAAAADSLLANRVEPFRRAALAVARTGSIDSTMADDWFSIATTGIEAVQAVQSASRMVTEAQVRKLSHDALLSLIRGVLLCLGTLLIGGAVMALVQWRVLRPLTKLTSVFEQIARGDTDVAMPDVTRPDEVGDLARAATSFRAVHLAGQNLAHALRRREHLLDLFIRHTPAAIAMLDAQLRYVAVSRRWLSDYELGERDLIGRSHYELFPETDDRWREIHQRCLRGDHASAVEDRLVRADGAIMWVRWAIHPWHDIDGQVGGIIMFTEVITARKQAEDEMRRLTTELQAIVDSADNAIIVTDPAGLIRAFNRGAERMLGYRAADMVGKETPKLFHDPAEMARAMTKLTNQLGQVPADPFDVFVHRARQGKPDQREWTYIARDGRRVPVLLSITAIRDASDTIQGFLGVAYDISHLKQMDRMKSEFISTVSHELRTPLTAIRASLGMVNSDLFGPLPAEARQLTDIAQDSTERLIRLINDLLDIEKIASGKMHFDLVPRSLPALLDDAMRDNAALAEKAGIRLLAGPGLDGPDRVEATVLVDPDRLAQAFANLISNAVKFSPTGSTITIAAALLPDGWVQASVTDQGIGIDEAFRARVFQRFAQADGSDSRAKGGTGLGLAITREIVERQGGRVGFDSQPGAGTRFHIDLPVHRGTAPPAPLPAAQISMPADILICEDDPHIARLLSLLLGRAGFTPVIAGTAAEAMTLLARQQFQAMTLDLMLPDLPGINLFRAIRAQPATRDLPVIIVTATGDAEREAVEGEAVGVIDWLSKPIDEDRLLAALHRAVQASADNGPRLLHVEDDADIRAIVHRLLSGHADIHAAGTLAEAQALARSLTFDAGLIDIDMPDGCGLDVITELRDRNGDPVPIVVFTGADASPVALHQVAATLVKSRVRNEELVDTIRHLIHRMAPGLETSAPSSPLEPVS
ncbi:MAG: PAS domain S-box protein [Niveispirillum sp.]|uniref:PAS domain S-box protein n=1 Tax=Niveispirillum sp. TaxID=1917217 RepID=UPI003BA76AB7